MISQIYVFFAAHRAFIIADNFFRIAALIDLRAAVFFEMLLAFLAPARFCFAHHSFFAALILARAAALIRRRSRPLAGLA